MIQSEMLRSILIADPNVAFLNAIKVDPKVNILPPQTVNLGRQAQLAIADQTKRFLAIVVNPNIDQPIGLSVIRFSKMHRPATPIIVIYDGEAPFDAKEAKQLGIHLLLQKPISYSQIVDHVAPNLVSFERKPTPSKNAIE